MRPLLLALALTSPLGAAHGQAPAGVNLTFLANEGVLLEGMTATGRRRVLIDALMLSYSDYALPPDSTQRRLHAARAPFDSVDLLLVTHRHGDHFHPTPVAAHLRANPRAALLTSPQVIDSLRAGAYGVHAAQLQPRRVLPGTTRRDTLNGVPVILLGLPHGGSRHVAVQHLGYVVELGGRRVLHLGDTDLSEATFAPMRLDTLRIDLALVPTWALTDADTRARILRHLGRARIAAFHMSDADRRERDALERAVPGVVVLQRPHTGLRVP